MTIIFAVYQNAGYAPMMCFTLCSRICNVFGIPKYVFVGSNMEVIANAQTNIKESITILTRGLWTDGPSPTKVSLLKLLPNILHNPRTLSQPRHSSINPIPTKGGHFGPERPKAVSHFHSFMTRVTKIHDFVHFSIPLVPVKPFLKKEI